jgi:phosphomannomutase
LKIIVDAGNGAGGFFADKVLVPLGADVQGSQFLEPDGRFPNHVPNPEDKDAMDSICQAVLNEKADLGIIFDTDVDRAAMVDAQGKAINRNDLIALISSVILDDHPGSVIVTDSITSAGLKTFIEDQLGGIHHRYQRGYKNVINESIRLNEAGRESWLAIETSGHAALKENHFLDDGAYLVAKLLIQSARMKQEGKSLVSLISSLQRPLEEQEYRLKITTSDFLDYGQKVLRKLAERIQGVPGWTPEEPNYEGIRVQCQGECEDGWFLLRMSLHDPVMPLNVESNLQGGIALIVKKLKRLLEEFKHLDNSPLYL